VMLIDGGITFESSHNAARMKDRKVLAMRKRIEAVGDPKLTDPQRRWRAVIEVTLNGGRKLTHQTMAAKGMFENPLTAAEENEKALDLIAPVLGKRKALALLAALWKLDQVKNVRTLRRLYQTEGRG
jgi:2-methylcitrate dehydratase PrpD